MNVTYKIIGSPLKYSSLSFLVQSQAQKNLVERDFVTLMSNNGPGQNFYRKNLRRKIITAASAG